METYFPQIEASRGEIARERIIADLDALVADAEALLRATADDASAAVEEIRVRLASRVAIARATCQKLRDSGINSARVVAQQMEETVHRYPYRSIAVAFGV